MALKMYNVSPELQALIVQHVVDGSAGDVQLCLQEAIEQHRAPTPSYETFGEDGPPPGHVALFNGNKPLATTEMGKRP